MYKVDSGEEVRETDRMEEQTTATSNATPAVYLPGTPVTSRLKKERNKTAFLVKKLSEESIQSPTMAPEYVILEVLNEETGEIVRKSVYVSDQNGTKTLDLYSGWNPETQKHKLSLKALPMKVCQLVTLERLWASHNKLSSLPAQLDQLTSLREVFLHRNNLEDIPACLTNLPCLQILWMNNNKITSIPDHIANLTTLKRLHLDYNFIKDIPESLCQLNQLEVLYLNDNTIHHVNEAIKNLNNLKRLYLHRNKIIELPIGITKLTNLHLLLLDDNEIRSVKREFSMFQANMEAVGNVVSLKNNPFVTPQSKLKLSLAGIGAPNPMALKTRRLSDQYERDMIKRPARISLPVGSDKLDNLEYKADTLPRSHTVSGTMVKQTSHEQ